MDGISPDLNEKMRLALREASRGKPLLIHRVGRVSVVAVSLAERMDCSMDSLIAVRLGAELAVLGRNDVEVWIQRPLSDLESTIVRLSLEYDRFTSENKAGSSDSYEAVGEWLIGDTLNHYEPSVLAALESIRSLIQPVEA